MISLGDGGHLDYRAYGGTVFADFDQPTSGPYQITGVRWPYLVGGRLMWETPLEGLRLGGSVQALELDTDILLTQYLIMNDPMTMMDVVVPSSTEFTLSISAVLWVASIEYAAHDLLLAAEYNQQHISLDSTVPTLYPATESVSQRMYGMIAYRFTDWFQASFYYSLFYPDKDDRMGRDSRQQDLALTARFDINEHWLFKLEGHFMNGTAGLDPALNDGVDRVRLTRDWAVILLKTTAYF